MEKCKEHKYLFFYISLITFLMFFGSLPLAWYFLDLNIGGIAPVAFRVSMVYLDGEHEFILVSGHCYGHSAAIIGESLYNVSSNMRGSSLNELISRLTMLPTFKACRAAFTKLIPSYADNTIVARADKIVQDKVRYEFAIQLNNGGVLLISVSSNIFLTLFVSFSASMGIILLEANYFKQRIIQFKGKVPFYFNFLAMLAVIILGLLVLVIFIYFIPSTTGFVLADYLTKLGLLAVSLTMATLLYYYLYVSLRDKLTKIVLLALFIVLALVVFSTAANIPLERIHILQSISTSQKNITTVLFSAYLTIVIGQSLKVYTIKEWDDMEKFLMLVGILMSTISLLGLLHFYLY